MLATPRGGCIDVPPSLSPPEASASPSVAMGRMFGGEADTGELAWGGETETDREPKT